MTLFANEGVNITTQTGLHDNRWRLYGAKITRTLDDECKICQDASFPELYGYLCTPTIW